MKNWSYAIKFHSSGDQSCSCVHYDMGTIFFITGFLVLAKHLYNKMDPGPRDADPPGRCFNIKMTLYQYRTPHCDDNTILRPSYICISMMEFPIFILKWGPWHIPADTWRNNNVIITSKHFCYEIVHCGTCLIHCGIYEMGPLLLSWVR